MDRICERENCDNVARINKRINNKIIRGRLCEKHHREKHPRTPNYWKWKGYFIKCSICGWDGPCDRHRIEEQGAYTKLNVISVCPNCHRLVHLGLYRFEGKNIIKNEGELLEIKGNHGWTQFFK